MFYLIASLAVTLASSAPLVAPVPEPVRFDDWIASCDNGRECQVLASSEDGSQEIWTVNVSRSATASAEPMVSIWPRFEDLDGPFRVIVDGAQPHFAFDAQGVLTSNATAFLRAIARGREAKVMNADGKFIALLPTKGASAALRWIDDQQEREASVTAIIATGSKPASAVPAPPSLPTIAVPLASSKPPKTLDAKAVEAIKQRGECHSSGHWEAEYFRLDSKHSLGLIPCGLGAYQAWSMVVTIDETGSWTPARLEQSRDWTKRYGSELPWLTWSVTSAGFVPEGRLLTEAAKGRGLGECGHVSSWAWDGEVFRLASRGEMNECRGTPPGEWPSLWRTTNSEAGFAN